MIKLQILVIINLSKNLEEESLKKIIVKLQPTQILVTGFLILIIIGTILLSLPAANVEHKSIGFINALFTSTSAVCVTGLVVVNTSLTWTLFGKIVIMCLIQIGGLGFMTLATALFMILGKKITLKERLCQATFLSVVLFECF